MFAYTTETPEECAICYNKVICKKMECCGQSICLYDFLKNKNKCVICKKSGHLVDLDENQTMLTYLLTANKIKQKEMNILLKKDQNFRLCACVYFANYKITTQATKFFLNMEKFTEFPDIYLEQRDNAVCYDSYEFEIINNPLYFYVKEAENPNEHTINRILKKYPESMHYNFPLEAYIERRNLTHNFDCVKRLYNFPADSLYEYWLEDNDKHNLSCNNNITIFLFNSSDDYKLYLKSVDNPDFETVLLLYNKAQNKQLCPELKKIKMPLNISKCTLSNYNFSIMFALICSIYSDNSLSITKLLKYVRYYKLQNMFEDFPWLEKSIIHLYIENTDLSKFKKFVINDLLKTFPNDNISYLSLLDIYVTNVHKVNLIIVNKLLKKKCCLAKEDSHEVICGIIESNFNKLDRDSLFCLVNLLKKCYEYQNTFCGKCECKFIFCCDTCGNCLHEVNNADGTNDVITDVVEDDDEEELDEDEEEDEEELDEDYEIETRFDQME